MVLVDTSVWIDHFRNNNKQLVELLNEDKVFCHQLVIGELACGNIKNRFEILTLLKSLPQSVNVAHDDILLFIEENKLMGLGLGYIDIQILRSSVLAGITLWTLDKKLTECSNRFNMCFSSP
jgi:predicted nucleic acid-binding protein